MSDQIRENMLRFADEVLHILEYDTDWSSDTTDKISDAAFEFGLADTDADGFFKVAKGVRDE